MRKIWSFIFLPTWGLYTVFFTHILLIKTSRTIRYSVTTIRVFEYYSEITYGPNMNSTIRSQLFEYQIIRIIRSNSGTYGLMDLSWQLHKGMTIEWRSYVIGQKFINSIYECGDKYPPDTNPKCGSMDRPCPEVYNNI